MNREQAVRFLRERPYKIGHMVGFTDLTELHNDWITEMVFGENDKTLQAHRGSFKTTCVSIALAEIVVMFPNDRTLFIRKTDGDVHEVIRQTKNILESDYMQYFTEAIYGFPLVFTAFSSGAINTNLTNDIKGTSQLVGTGISSSLTGKHYDRIFTDDIVNVKDRVSRADRERTKLIYQELQNIKNRGGRIFNTGTPWHKEDCFTLMPNASKFDCYSTGLMSEEQIEDVKGKMTRSLFAANYELKHIADEDILFETPDTGLPQFMAEQGICHIDAAYFGEDYTAFTIGNKKDGEYYLFGKVWRKHIDDCEHEIISLRKKFNAGKIFCEDNGDKGYLAKSLKRKGERTATYHESMNKHVKITTYLKDIWKHVHFIEGTDEEYINMICDYNEDAQYDDAPDSAACMARLLRNKGTEYKPLWNK